MIPLLRAGTALEGAIGIALVADTLSIATMEITDNAILLAWPGAMEAGLGDLLFWASLAIALAVAVRSSDVARATRSRTRRTATGTERAQPVRAQGRGLGSGVRTGSSCARRCSKAGGRTSASPRCSGSSSTAKPGPFVAISKRTPLGSRK
jgi:hypothetical protein